MKRNIIIITTLLAIALLIYYLYPTIQKGVNIVFGIDRENLSPRNRKLLNV